MSHYDDVEQFFPTRKEGRKARKLAKAKDRSQFKKSDQDKKKLEKLPGGLVLGRVLAIKAGEIVVDCDKKELICTLKGSLKQHKKRIKNLITIGDEVFLDEKDCVIHAVKERHSSLARADHLLQRDQQLIAANIDLVLITVSVVSPPLKTSLIDRYVIAARKGNMEPVIVINKIDLLQDDKEEQKLYALVKKTYESLGIKVLGVSTKTGDGLDALKLIMKGKTSVFSGQSGAGKSTLINATLGLALPTGKITKGTLKGVHTTTSATLVPLGDGGFCIDTPGIRSFGLWNLEPEDLRLYFDEIQEWGLHCKYSGCTHTKEINCAVKKAVEQGKISNLRYESYLKLLQEIESGHQMR